MKDGWQTYETEVDGLLCSISAHLALKEQAPDPHLGVCYVIRVGLLAPAANGLVEREEQLALDAIERELDDSLAGMAGAAFAGHITGGGTRDFFFYGPMAELLDPVLAQMQADFPHYTIVGGAEPDPNWEQFLYTICPADPAVASAGAEAAVPVPDLADVPLSEDFETVELPPPVLPPQPVTDIAPPAPRAPVPTQPIPRPPGTQPVAIQPAPPVPVTEIAPPAPMRAPEDPQLELVQSKIDKRLEQLLAAGDLPERERPVSHWIAFRDEELRRDFLQQVNHGEFEQETLETNDDGSMKWWARLEKSQTTEAQSVRATVSRLVKIAANYGGEYDALETCVSKRV